MIDVCMPAFKLDSSVLKQVGKVLSLQRLTWTVVCILFCADSDVHLVPVPPKFASTCYCYNSLGPIISQSNSKGIDQVSYMTVHITLVLHSGNFMPYGPMVSLVEPSACYVLQPSDVVARRLSTN
jgi:hypothetical protein